MGTCSLCLGQFWVVARALVRWVAAIVRLVAIDLVQSPFILFNSTTAKQNVCTPSEPDIFGDLSSLLKCFWSKVRDDSVQPLAQRTKNAYLTTIPPSNNSGSIVTIGLLWPKNHRTSQFWGGGGSRDDDLVHLFGWSKCIQSLRHVARSFARSAPLNMNRTPWGFDKRDSLVHTNSAPASRAGVAFADGLY
jgi:hypothetical protein